MNGLKKKDYQKIKDELDNCQRPLFFFDDDTDGLCSFLLLYRYKREGSGIVVKTGSGLDSRFIHKVKEYSPDKIFLLDLANVSDDFLDDCGSPVVWIDHHAVQEPHPRVKYFNPRSVEESDNTCVSDLCYRVVEDDLSIAVLGIVGDWQLSETTKKFAQEHPELLNPQIDRPEIALFDSPVGKMTRIYEFLLKGNTQKVLQSIKILTRIDDPWEIIKKDSSRARWLMNRFEEINQGYEEIIKIAKESVSDDDFLIFTYRENQMSFSGELSNELLYLFPQKVIIVAREKSGQMKCSFRSAKFNLPIALQSALTSINGYGGGHEHACGGCINVEDWDDFIEQLRYAIDQQKETN